MPPWVIVAVASVLAVAVDRATREPFHARTYMGVPYTVGEMDDVFYWRLTPGPGQTLYLGQPGTGRAYPTGVAADEAARWHIYHRFHPQLPAARRPAAH